jgi:ribonuclease J
MRITIHGGADQIGASCLEVSNQEFDLYFDVGSPLDGSPRQLPAEIRKADAVFISHPHEDHFGLLEQVPEAVPVYLGQVGLEIIQAARLFKGLPLVQRDFRPLKHWQPVSLNGATITPYPMDHSAIDAYGFEVRSKGCDLFYSGDFRGHGRKAWLLDRLAERSPEPVDILIMEGTVMGREPGPQLNEQDIENEMADLWGGSGKLSFLICSGQNIDRLVSAFKACLRTGRDLVVDIYTAWIMEKAAGLSNKLPRLGWNNLRVLSHGVTAGRHYGCVKRNREYFGPDFYHRLYNGSAPIDHAELASAPYKYVIKTNQADRLLDKLGVNKADVVYSMWPGYLEKEHNPRGSRALCALRDDSRVDFHIMHSSGHACLADLRRLYDALQPDTVVPIHTMHPENYHDVFPGAKVRIMREGQGLEFSRS